MYIKKPTLQEIENLRHLLVKSANDKGFTNDETIHVSQRLDYLLNRYEHYEKIMDKIKIDNN